MRELGANAIRVYQVDERRSHEVCMNIFADAGIYVFVNLDGHGSAIDESDPRWTDNMFRRYAATMDGFHMYPNLAGFFVGDKTITRAENAFAAPFLKAAIRDMKTYRDVKGYRAIPIGHASTDLPAILGPFQRFLSCGQINDQADFLSIGSFKWCGDSSYEQSGYLQMTEAARSLTVPIFFSETGCTTVKPRVFMDQDAIFGLDMSVVWSGAVVYEWIEEVNRYGLVSYGPFVPPDSQPDAPPDGFPRTGKPIPIEPEFSNLKRQWAEADPISVSMKDYVAPDPSGQTACPPSFGNWLVDPQSMLPEQPSILRLLALSHLRPQAKDVVGEGMTGRQTFSSCVHIGISIGLAALLAWK